MKKLIYLIVLALILGLVLTGCSLLSNIGQAPATEQSGITYLTKHTVDDPWVIELLAGQTIPVGTVSVWNDDTNLYVQYETTGDWVMTETHLAVATTLGGIPQNKNDNPIPGHFPYNHEDLGCITSDPYTIPLSEIGAEGVECEELLYIAAHAVVQNGSVTETAWGGGLPFGGKNWATYFTYTVQPVLVDAVIVDAKKTTSTCSAVILESGKEYRLKASGVAGAGDTILFDAKYSITQRISGDTWTDDVSGYTGYGPDLLGLAVDGVFVDWGVYNEGHVYYWNMYGGDSCVALWVYDIYYPNNTEFLTVEIYLLP